MVGANSCTVVYDYFLENEMINNMSDADLQLFITESLKASDQVFLNK